MRGVKNRMAGGLLVTDDDGMGRQLVPAGDELRALDESARSNFRKAQQEHDPVALAPEERRAQGR